MDKKELLNRYKIKLSIFFAGFVLFCFYIIQGIFLGLQFYNSDFETKEHLLKKLIGVENVLKNKDEYYSQIQSENKTLQKILLKTLENTIIYQDNKKIINFYSDDIIIDDEVGFVDYKNKKILVSYITLNNLEYKIIILEDNVNNFYKYLKDYIFFIIFSSPFFLVFYFLGFFIIGKYFKVITQTIESLENFTSNVNHEMKTPISEVISTLSLAKKIKNYDEAIDISLNSISKLNKILDSIVGIAYLSDLNYQKQRINLVYELEEIIDSFKQDIKQKGILIQKDIKNKSYNLKLNKEHFYLCVRNLLSNAIKYSYMGGKIEIIFNSGELQIKDYGIGIDKDNLKKIFNRYFRENYIENEGFGIGLNLVKKVVDLNNWKIQIDSDKNKYTLFSINFN